MDLFEQLACQKKFTGALIQAFAEKFGGTFYKALEKLETKNMLVQKYIFLPSEYTLWLVQGEKVPYFIYPELFCECKAFTLNAIYRQKKYIPCKHLLARQIAEILGQFVLKEFPDEKFTEIAIPLIS